MISLVLFHDGTSFKNRLHLTPIIMKILLLPFVVLSILATTTGTLAQLKSDVEEKELRGRVKKIETFYMVAETKNGKEVKSPQPAETISFNHQGWINEIIRYHDGNLEDVTTFGHDRNGRRILHEVYRNQVRGDPNETYRYSYDKAGRLIESKRLVVFRESTKTIEHNLYTYDNRDNLIEFSHFDLASDQPENTIYTYDSENRRTSEKKMGSNGKLLSNTKWIFNDKGQAAKVIIDDEILNYTYVTSLTYDEKNRPLKEEMTTLSGKGAPGTSEPAISKKIYSYDDAKLTKEERVYANDVLQTTTIFSFDKYGNELGKLETMSGEVREELAAVLKRPDGDLTQAAAMVALLGMFAREAFKYEYDSYGNWTKRIEFGATEFVIGQDNLDAELKPVRTQVRVITYYE